MQNVREPFFMATDQYLIFYLEALFTCCPALS